MTAVARPPATSPRKKGACPLTSLLPNPPSGASVPSTDAAGAAVSGAVLAGSGSSCAKTNMGQRVRAGGHEEKVFKKLKSFKNENQKVSDQKASDQKFLHFQKRKTSCHTGFRVPLLGEVLRYLCCTRWRVVDPSIEPGFRSHDVGSSVGASSDPRWCCTRLCCTRWFWLVL